MKLELAGGVALPICPVGVGSRGGTWGPDDVIVFSPSPAAGLQRVSAEGGSPEPVTMIDRSAGEASHRYPYFLPDGRTVVFLVLSVAATESVGAEAENRVDAVRLDTGERRNLLVGAANAEFAGGELLFYRGGALLARRLDLDSLELTGETRVLVEGLKYDANYERAIFSTSERTLVYEKGTFRGASQLTWIDRQGETVGSLGEGRFYPSISPGGRRAAFVVSSGDGQQSYLMADLELDVERPVISNQTIVGDAIWSPDGSRFAYGAVSDTSADVFVASVEEGSTERLFDAPDVSWYPRDWSPDGRFLLLQSEIAEGIWTYDFESPSEPSILLTAQGSGILFPKLSPDGRWLAYSTDEGGNFEVWTTSFPPGERRWRVSQGGGLEPTWAADGRSLYYRTMGNRFFEAEIVVAGESLRIGQSTLLFDALLGSDIDAPMYDVTPDGERFLVNTMSEEEARIPLTVAFNWKSGL